MSKRIWAFALIAAILCVGCMMKKPSAGWPVVSEISATMEQNGLFTHNLYTDPSKMRQILNLLRDLGQQFTPDIDPDSLNAPQCSIYVSFTDGSQRAYHIKSDRYIRTDSSPWQQADPERIDKLRQLLQALPGDLRPF